MMKKKLAQALLKILINNEKYKNLLNDNKSSLLDKFDLSKVSLKYLE